MSPYFRASLASILVMLLITPVKAAEGDVWFTAPFSSWHRDNKKYNERNLGLGFQYEITDTLSVFAVRFDNSFDVPTTGIGFPITPRSTQLTVDHLTVKFGVTPTFFLGYSRDKWDFIVLPTVDVLWDKSWGLSIITDFRTFAGFSMKINLRVLE